MTTGMSRQTPVVTLQFYCSSSDSQLSAPRLLLFFLSRHLPALTLPDASTSSHPVSRIIKGQTPMVQEPATHLVCPRWVPQHQQLLVRDHKHVYGRHLSDTKFITDRRAVSLQIVKPDLLHLKDPATVPCNPLTISQDTATSPHHDMRSSNIECLACFPSF